METYDLSLLARVKGRVMQCMHIIGEFLSWEHATCLILYFSPPWLLTTRGHCSFRGTVAPMFWCLRKPRETLACGRLWRLSSCTLLNMDLLSLGVSDGIAHNDYLSGASNSTWMILQEDLSRKTGRL